MSTPMCRIRPVCCARAASGHATAPLPITLMKSRRLMAAPAAYDKASYRFKLDTKRVRIGLHALADVGQTQLEGDLFSREFMLLDGAFKRFRHTFDPVVKAVISLNWQYAN